MIVLSDVLATDDIVVLIGDC